MSQYKQTLGHGIFLFEDIHIQASHTRQMEIWSGYSVKFKIWFILQQKSKICMFLFLLLLGSFCCLGFFKDIIYLTCFFSVTKDYRFNNIRLKSGEASCTLSVYKTVIPIHSEA